MWFHRNPPTNMSIGHTSRLEVGVIVYVSNWKQL